MDRLNDMLVKLEIIMKDENMSFDEILNELSDMYTLKYNPHIEDRD